MTGFKAWRDNQLITLSSRHDSGSSWSGKNQALMADAGASAGASASTAWHDISTCLTASMGVVMSMAFAVARTQKASAVIADMQGSRTAADDGNSPRSISCKNSDLGLAGLSPQPRGQRPPRRKTHGDHGHNREALSCPCVMLDALVRETASVRDSGTNGARRDSCTRLG